MNPSHATLSPWVPGIFNLIVFITAVILLMLLLLFLSSWLGVQKRSDEKRRPYESGIIPTGSARLRYPVPFFLVAIFFLLFDVEGVFIFSWAVACKALGWVGWLQMALFIFVLVLGLIYIWYKGGLSWYPKPEKD
jgi:NADH-quinone oxidoreductase subunit A